MTQFYFNLHKPILAELVRQGHEVYVEEDKPLPMDPNSKTENVFRRTVKRFCRRVVRTESLYWKKKIGTCPEYNVKYDLFLCIDGTSFNPVLLEHLKGLNPGIKSVLYLWDTNKYYDFFRYNHFFDRVMTFDLDDANTSGVELLHSYWYPSEPRPVKYKLFIVGSDHDDRLNIISNVYQQLQAEHMPSFLRVVIRRPGPFPILQRILRFGKYSCHRKIALFEEKRKLPVTSEDKVPVDKILQYIDESECILDTDMPIQTGATERVIWALARGKKIISTNYNLKCLPFFNKDQIKFIDRKNPIIDMDFLKKEESFPISEEIQNLRIDKWIHRLIDFDEDK